MQRSRLTRTLPWVVGLAALALYAATAAPSIVELYDDSLEFQLVLPTFNIPHPTGYPLYSLLGGLWSRVIFPVGNWAWRVNLFSALAGGIAVGLVTALGQRISRSDWAGVVAGALFALGPVWWQQTTVAEVYALHGLLVAAILLVTVRVGEKLGREDAPSAPSSLQWGIGAIFLLIGLGLAHHRTTVLLLPGVGLYLLGKIPGLWRPRRVWLLWIGALVLPLLLYLYIPLRVASGGVDLEGAYVNSWSGFWDHVLARQYTSFFDDNPLAVDRSAADWFTLFRLQIGWPGLVLAGLGLASGLRSSELRSSKLHQRGLVWLLIGLTFLVTFIFTVLYRVADAPVFAIPAYMALALFAGQGMATFVQQTQTLSQRMAAAPQIRTLFALGSSLLLVGLLLLPMGRGAAVNRQNDWAIHDYAVAMANVDFPPESRVVGLRGQMTALAYMQQAEGLGTKALPVALDDPTVRQQFVVDAVAHGEPVYLTQEVGGIGDQFSFSGHGPLVRVWPRGEARTDRPAHPVELTMLDGALSMPGYAVAWLDQAGGPMLALTLFWLPNRPVEPVVKVSLRLQQSDGTPVIGPDGAPIVADRFPLRQAALSPEWLPAEQIQDVHLLSIPESVSESISEPVSTDGALTLLVIVYDAATGSEFGRFPIILPPK